MKQLLCSLMVLSLSAQVFASQDDRFKNYKPTGQGAVPQAVFDMSSVVSGATRHGGSDNGQNRRASVLDRFEMANAEKSGKTASGLEASSDELKNLANRRLSLQVPGTGERRASSASNNEASFNSSMTSGPATSPEKK